jgi:hypothetical protein
MTTQESVKWSLDKLPPYLRLSDIEVEGFPPFEILVLEGVDGLDTINDNVDIEVVFDTGERWVATFFTLQNLESLFKKNRETGECGSGLYFWCSDMVIVKTLTVESIVYTVVELLREGEFESAFAGVHAEMDTAHR